MQASRADGTSYTANLTRVTKYDLMGRAVQALEEADDAGTAALEQLALRGSLGRRQQYDAAGQLIAEIDATHFKTEYAYDAYGNRVGTRNALGIVFLDSFDANGNLIRHMCAADAARGAGRHRVSQHRHGGGARCAAPVARTINRYQYDQANRRFAEAEAIPPMRSASFSPGRTRSSMSAA